MTGPVFLICVTACMSIASMRVLSLHISLKFHDTLFPTIRRVLFACVLHFLLRAVEEFAAVTLW